MDVSIPTLRYFCALADHLHFGAAAESLNISSPSLSQQISRLERLVGERLFDRTSREVALTDAGRALLPQARRVVDAHDELTAWIAARHGRTSPALRIGLVAAGAGPLTTAAIMSAVQQIPDLRLEMRKVGFFDAEAELTADRVDAVFAPAPLPLDERSVQATPLWSEPRVLIVSAAHPLAGRDAVTIGELGDETFIAVSGGDPDALAWWLVDPRPDGTHPAVGALAQDMDGILELVAAGVGVNIAASSAATHYRRPNIAFIPIVDIEPATVLLCTRRRVSPTVAAFVEIVLTESQKPVAGA
ncbi:LysR family transcriptional regulator [Microbacterium protaetiae]|uniref:LysR family transcriptional regulator n=1 Tax=Microbacterium protaetiae TaxID=2509458 RepID=A0A4P6EE48_9MICO|nr:LysR family transcriptional regulator [Microbacterium protaetiae]QAY59349.1 LysR family transcriptional regulator [Microbacterium protaetiae]